MQEKLDVEIDVAELEERAMKALSAALDDPNASISDKIAAASAILRCACRYGRYTPPAKQSNPLDTDISAEEVAKKYKNLPDD